MIPLHSRADQDANARHQIELLEVQLSKEFSELPAAVVHREVACVSERLLAQAHFTDHVAVLTGRFAAEHLRAVATQVPLAQKAQQVAPDPNLPVDGTR
jgi:hypothetical protein